MLSPLEREEGNPCDSRPSWVQRNAALEAPLEKQIEASLTSFWKGTPLIYAQGGSCVRVQALFSLVMLVDVVSRLGIRYGGM